MAEQSQHKTCGGRPSSSVGFWDSLAIRIRRFCHAEAKVGQEAPDFTLKSQTGAFVTLSQFRGHTVVLYFYPKDNTRGCIVESSAFRDSYEVFKKAGAEVIGVSSDSPESHQAFAAQYQLPFLLLSDPDNAIRRRYGVPSTIGLIPGRVSYLIDKEGVIRHIFNSQFQPASHVDSMLNALQEPFPAK